jgi:hypothetical protein
VAGVARRRRRLCDVALILFVQGAPVPPEAVKAGYAAFFDRTQGWLGRTGSRADRTLKDSTAKAERLARYSGRTLQGRRMLTRLRRGVPDERPAGVFTSVWQNFFSILQTGRAIADEDGLQELFVAGGLDAAGREIIPGTDKPLAPDFPAGIPEVMARMRLADVRQRIATASAEELLAARDDYLTVVQALKGLAIIAQLLMGSRDAFGFAAILDLPSDEISIAAQIPLMLLVKPEMENPEAKELMNQLRSRAAAFAAAGTLLATLPASTKRRLRRRQANPFVDLSDADRERLQAVVKATQL